MRNLLTFWNRHKNTWGHFLWMGFVILFLGSIIVCTGHSPVFIALMVCVEVIQFDRHAYTMHSEGIRHPILDPPLAFIPAFAAIGLPISFIAAISLATEGPIKPMIGFAMFLGAQVVTSRFIHRLQHGDIARLFDKDTWQGLASFLEAVLAVSAVFACVTGCVLLAGL